jgi:hypothetical protein
MRLEICGEASSYGFGTSSTEPYPASGLYWNRLSVLADGNVHNLSLRHSRGLMWRHGTCRFHRDADGDRRAANLYDFGIKADEISNENRRDELNLAHGDCHQVPIRMLVRLHHTRQIEGTEDDAAKDRAQGIGVARHHDDANRRL